MASLVRILRAEINDLTISDLGITLNSSGDTIDLLQTLATSARKWSNEEISSSVQLKQAFIDKKASLITEDNNKLIQEAAVNAIALNALQEELIYVEVDNFKLIISNTTPTTVTTGLFWLDTS